MHPVINQLKHKKMAKYYNNKIKTGRVAGSVFAVRNGEVIERAYNPIVANPRTDAQLLQRAKMNLAGQISHLVDWLTLTSMSMPYKGKNRTMFVRNIVNKATAGMVGKDAVAKIAPEDIIFSRGSVTPVATAAAPVVTADDVTVTLTPASGIEDNTFGERVVVLVYESADAMVPMGAFTGEALLAADDPTSVEVPIPFGMRTGNVLAVYRVPYRVANYGVSVKASEMEGTPQQISAALTRSGDNVLWGETIFVGAQVFTQA